MILCYEKSWWTPQSCGLCISYRTPAAVIRDTSVPIDSQFSLTLFIGGEPGIAWSKLPQHERRAQALKQVAAIFGPNITAEEMEELYKPIEIFEQEWTKEQWSKGAPCPVTTPGLLTEAGKALAEPAGNVHFVGTETSTVWSGYMEGAVRSGMRGAKEVVEKLFEGRVAARL